MKEGVTDPFAQDETTGKSDDSDKSPSQTSQSDQTDETVTQTVPETEPNQTKSNSNTKQYDRSDLPRMLTRDTVKADRDHVHQLFVYDDTHKQEKDARRKLEDRLGDDIYKLDVREAIYRAGMRNLDDAEDILREWGADI